ncbi:MAG: GntR family transcriptional regulator [Cellulosilyticum sp.]|nr:GntR family transcriptional regulator [Cellulosilyticum sp.]
MILYDKYENETAKDYAYRVIKANIMELNLKPGELVSEIDLAKKLNMSRTPIREVFIRLKSKRLVEVKPQIGTYVSYIDWKLVEESIFVRCTLEKEALRQACIQFDEMMLHKMEECLIRQQAIAEQSEQLLEFHELDKAFHRYLFNGINKYNVWDMVFNLSIHYSRMRLLAEKNLNKNFIVGEHSRYLDIIKNKKIEEIDEAVETHIGEELKVWEKLINQNQDMAHYIINR